MTREAPTAATLGKGKSARADTDKATPGRVAQHEPAACRKEVSHGR